MALVDSLPTIGGRYEVIRPLGAGGGGVVYQAMDARLSRSVAIKLLPQREDDTSDAVGRVLDEARAISRVSHPNVCIVHDVGVTPERMVYIAMEYYEGESLRTILDTTRLDVDEAGALLLQVTEGVAAAHEAGVVHRDIKASNVVVDSSGRAVLVDFGLATPLVRGGSRDGLPVGTPAYMAPELFLGGEATVHSDIWSLGVLGFEMLYGRQPFTGPDIVATIDAIRNVSPGFEPVGSGAGPLITALATCLRKDPAQRHETARALAALLNDFQHARPAGDLTAVSHRAGVVVLPFTMSGGAADDDFLCDALTEGVIDSLSRQRDLRVISYSSSLALKGVVDPLATVGADLSVERAVEGSIRAAPEGLHIRVAVADTGSRSTVWSEHFTASRSNLLDQQEEICRQLTAVLTEAAVPGSSAAPELDLDAWEKYHRARQQILRYSTDGLHAALSHFEDARREHPESLLLAAGEAYVCWQIVNAGVGDPLTYLARARNLAELVVATNPDSVHGHRLIGLISLFEGNGAEGVERLKAALRIEPNDPDTLFWLVVYSCLIGQTGEVRPLAERLAAIDPLTPINACLPGWIAMMDGDFSSAVGPFTESHRRDPVNPIIAFVLGQVHAYLGDLRAAERAWATVRHVDPDSFFAQLARLMSAACHGDGEAVTNASTELLEQASADPQYSWHVAECYAQVGDSAEALNWLSHAVQLGFVNYPMIAYLDPFLANVRDEKGFADLAAEAREAWLSHGA